MWERTITVNSFSKSWNISGWRLGYAYGKGELLAPVNNAVNVIYVCAATPLQTALSKVLMAREDYYNELRDKFDAKRRFFAEGLTTTAPAQSRRIRRVPRKIPACECRGYPSGGGPPASSGKGRSTESRGCLKASSCEEKILVDSRWGVDVYDKDGNGIGLKVPLRKPGAPAHIYGPANLLLHFHADGTGPTNEVAGRIENLEDVLFWTDVRLDKTADTNTWPAIVDVDVFAAQRGDEANDAPPDDVCADPAKLDEYEKRYWSNGADSEKFDKAIIWGTPPVNADSIHCTFRIAGLTKEASLNKHLIESSPDSTEQRPVGAILRNITLSRGFIASDSNDVGDAARGIRAAGEHLIGFLEQITSKTEEGGEGTFGWQAAATDTLVNYLHIDKDESARVLEDLQPAVRSAKIFDDSLQEVTRRATIELEHLFEKGDGASEKIREKLVAPLQKIAEVLKEPPKLKEAPDAWRSVIQSKLDSSLMDLRSDALGLVWDDKTKKWKFRQKATEFPLERPISVWRQ